MNDRIKAIFYRQIDTGYACLYTSISCSLFAVLSVLNLYTRMTSNLPADFGGFIFITPILYLISIGFGLPAFFGSSYFEHPWAIRLRVMTAIGIGSASMASLFLFIVKGIV